MEFENKTVVITGGATGIGWETARAFLERGANVVLNGRREMKLQEAITGLDPTGKHVAYLAGDIGKPETARQLVRTAVQRFGGVDILVNNAGIFKPTPFLDHTEEDYNAYVNIILGGTFHASQAAIPEMQKRGAGAIVNTGSMWASQAIGATPSSAYSAAKAGVHALTRNLAIEFAADHIRVNAVAPAVVETPVYNTFLSEEQVKEVLPTFNNFHPLGRNGQPQDVTSAIVFLASSQADWITGVVLPVDGGVMAGQHAK
ncbi:MAG: SDR family oxidoreductase [Gammaproteobacteria bacterium]|nr:SDR family oxidoreductase [Gammaproteobacteria bacterium]